MRYICSFNGKSIFFLCSDALKDTAEFFSAVLQHEDTAHDVIEDNRTIQVGWGFYKVLQSGGEYQILACDIENDPFQTVTEDLSLKANCCRDDNRIRSKVQDALSSGDSRIR